MGRARWGDTAHKVFFCYALTTNVIVTAMLLLGGAGVLSALTGMSAIAACMLIPIAVAFKTCWGGLEITYFSSLLTTCCILAATVFFTLRVYAHNDGDVLGSPLKMWSNLNAYASMPMPDMPSDEVKSMQLGPVAGQTPYYLIGISTGHVTAQ